MRPISVLVAIVTTAALILGGCSSTPEAAPQPVADVAAEVEGDTDAEPPDGGDDADDDGWDDDADDADDDGYDIDDPADDEPADQLPGMDDTGDGAPGVPSLEDLFGGGGCMAVTNLLVAWGMTLLGPLTEDTQLTQSDVDAMFEGSADLPAEVRPHITVLQDALNAAVGQPVGTVIDIVGSPEVTDAMDALGAYSETESCFDEG